MNFICSSKNKHKKLPGGFSLVELMVTIGIIILLTGSVLVKYSSFNNLTLLKSQALEISLDIRTAQTYGVSVRADSGASRKAYGMYFDPAMSNQYLLFNDIDGDLLYDPGEQVGDTYILDSRFIIHQVCTPANCSSNRKGSVAFKRPNFDAVIARSNAGGSSYNVRADSYIEFVIASVNDTSVTKKVVVYQSGQVAIE